MSVTRDTLAAYLCEYLRCDDFNDYAPNGVQIEGKASIHCIATAVTASEAIIQEAIVLQADALLVHHGYFWRGEHAVITGMKRQRIAQLLKHDISLYAYHLPLDCHLEVGNNACLGNMFDNLGLESVQMHTVNKVPNLLWSGLFKEPVLASTLIQLLDNTLQRTPLYIAGTEKPIRHIAWCSGAAQDFIEDAHRIGADAYLSGEVSERTYYQANELRMHYFSGGHHATERFGIQALGNHLASHFDVQHHFIDSDNPV